LFLKRGTKDSRKCKNLNNGTFSLFLPRFHVFLKYRWAVYPHSLRKLTPKKLVLLQIGDIFYLTMLSSSKLVQHLVLKKKVKVSPQHVIQVERSRGIDLFSPNLSARMGLMINATPRASVEDEQNTNACTCTYEYRERWRNNTYRGKETWRKIRLLGNLF
jgi:hypothetical protein